MAAAPTGENELWLLLSDLIWHKISGKARQMWHERCPSCLAVSRIHSHSCSGGHRAPAVKNKTHSPPLPPHSSPCSLPPKPYLNFSSFQAQSLTLSSTFTPKLALLQDPPGHTNSAFPTLPGGISSRAGNCHARGSRALGQGYPPHPPWAQLGFQEGFLGSQRILAALRICGTWHWCEQPLKPAAVPKNDTPNASCRQVIWKARADLFQSIDFYLYFYFKGVYFKYQLLSGFFWLVCYLVSEPSAALLLLSSVLGVDLLLQWETKPGARQVQNKWTKVKSDGLLELEHQTANANVIPHKSLS